jgi:redox-sensitive bicupin YhaK (pirin superfamily)
MEAHSSVETTIVPRERDLGDGFTVRRALPAVERRMVGPFIFFDQMGPALLQDGQGLDVRPHPHIGLATVTYLFEGEILHRDSLGTMQVIQPGAVNWMTAGRGIVHSERTPPQVRTQSSKLFGIQTWVALPKAHEEAEPSFAHHDVSELPVFDDAGVTVRLIAGTLFGQRSPVKTFSEMFYADAMLPPGSRLALDAGHEERAVYVAEGAAQIERARFPAGQLVLLRPGNTIVIEAPEHARLVLLGGEPLDGPRHIWWNLVSSSADRIRQAAEDWQAGRFPAVPDETEFIPLPEPPYRPVTYP